MNKLWFVMAFALIFSFVGCSDDDDDKTTDYAKKIEGTYTGSIAVPAMGQIPAQTIPDVDIKVDYAAVNRDTLRLDEVLPIAGQSFPLKANCAVITSDNGDGKTKLEGSVTVKLNSPITFPLIGPISEIPISIIGTVDATGNAAIDIKVMSGVTTVKFTGKKK